METNGFSEEESFRSEFRNSLHRQPVPIAYWLIDFYEKSVIKIIKLKKVTETNHFAEEKNWHSEFHNSHR